MRPARFLALHLPAFRLERCGYDAEEPAILIGFERNAMRVQALTPAAVELGLRPGMTVSEARSVEPDLLVDVFDPEAEATDRGELLRALERLSDHIQPLGEQDFVIEISTTARVHGGEEGMSSKAVELVEGLGHRIQWAITDDPLAALALARLHETAHVPAGRMADALAGLPVRSLRTSNALCEALRAIGVETLGQLAGLDRASVAGRFGDEGLRLYRLASGRQALLEEGTLAWVADDLPVVQTPLAGATTTLQLHFVLPGLLSQLSRALADKDLAAVQLRGVLLLETGGFVGFGVRVGRPTRDVRTLEHLIRCRLATLSLEAPVEEWRIEVREAVPDRGWQPGLTERAEASEPLPDVLARLQDALGEQAVFCAEPVERWCPEKAWRPVPVPLRPPLRRPPKLSDDVVDRQERWETTLRWPRPTQLLEKPRRIEVDFEHRRPVRVRLPEGWRAVERADGPERLSGEWWDPDGVWERTYWVVELPGARNAWIFMSDGHCWLHGWF